MCSMKNCQYCKSVKLQHVRMEWRVFAENATTLSAEINTDDWTSRIATPSNSWYGLRNRRHSYTPNIKTLTDERNFITRLLFKDMCWLLLYYLFASCFHRTQWTAEGSVFGAVSLWVVRLCVKYLGNRWTDLRQIHNKDVPGPSLGRVWMSRSKVKVPRKKRHFSALSAACAQFTVCLVKHL